MSEELRNETELRTQADTQIQQDIDNINLMPIGSIVAWIIKPTKESMNQTFLPEGWMRCDGSTIPPPSIWAGPTTPDLNGKKHFLRGGSDSEYLEIEEDQIQDLALSITDPGHTHSSGSHSHDSIDDKYLFMDHWCGHKYDSKVADSSEWDYWQCSDHIDGNSYPDDWWRTSKHSVSTEQITINSELTSISLEQANYRAGEETRPINTKVIWIMRIW